MIIIQHILTIHKVIKIYITKEKLKLYIDINLLKIIIMINQ